MRNFQLPPYELPQIAQEPEFRDAPVILVSLCRSSIGFDDRHAAYQEDPHMRKEDSNKAVVGRWFSDFWGKQVNLAVIDEVAAPNMLLKYSLHAPRRGRADIKAFMSD